MSYLVLSPGCLWTVTNGSTIRTTGSTTQASVIDTSAIIGASLSITNSYNRTISYTVASDQVVVARPVMTTSLAGSFIYLANLSSDYTAVCSLQTWDSGVIANYVNLGEYTAHPIRGESSIGYEGVCDVTLVTAAGDILSTVTTSSDRALYGGRSIGFGMLTTGSVGYVTPFLDLEAFPVSNGSIHISNGVVGSSVNIQ